MHISRCVEDAILVKEVSNYLKSKFFRNNNFQTLIFLKLSNCFRVNLKKIIILNNSSKNKTFKFGMSLKFLNNSELKYCIALSSDIPKLFRNIVSNNSIIFPFR